MDLLLMDSLRALGLDADSPPDAAAWHAHLEAVSAHLAQREARVQSLERMVTELIGDIGKLRTHIGRQREDVGDILGKVTDTITVFQDAVRGEPAALEQALTLARRRFSLQLNASWSTETDVPEDTAALDEMSTSIKVMQGNLRRLGKALSDLVTTANTVASTEQQLELAGSVQRMLVPAAHLELPQVKLWSWFEPATHCGGDWWTAAALSTDATLVVVGDVTGHGAPSAIVAGTAKGACDLARMGMRNQLQALQLMRMLNRVIIESADGHYMMTGLAMKFVAGKVHVSNAGHPPPILLRDGALTQIQTVREPPLGAQQVFAYTEHVVEVRPGDRLVAFTDGIPEAEDADGKQLGDRALRALLEASAREPSAQIVERVRAMTQRHRGERAATDDISFVVCEIG